MRVLTFAAAIAACGSGLALGTTGPTLRVARGCYLVGRPVRVHGTGFAASRTYVLTIDGVYFGQDSTDANGALAPRPIFPGGLPAGWAQAVDHVAASDGTRTARATFTLTRPAGVRFLAISGSGTAITASIEVWGFSLSGVRQRVFVHYIEPSGAERSTVALGRTRGQCGHLRTAPRRIFPFSPTPGNWTFQFDTRRTYSLHPRGPVVRIEVAVR